MTEQNQELLRIQNQLLYRAVDPSLKLQCVTRIGVPHPLQTTVGTWIHLTIIENNLMDDPNNCLFEKINIPKEHSIYIYNPFLDLKEGLDIVPLKELLKFPANVPQKLPLARIHSSCRYGDTFGSLRCDCGPQLFAAKKAIVQNGLGFILYLDQEGRNIGLLLKAASYRLMQQFGLPTDESLKPLKVADADLRSYQVAVDVFKVFGVDKVQLLTNNPKKFQLLMKNGVEIVQCQLSLLANEHNKKYLLTKKQNMGHSLLDPQNDVSECHSPTKIAQVVNRIHQQINSGNVKRFEFILDNQSNQTDTEAEEFAAFFGEKNHPKYFFLSNFYEQKPVQTPEDGWFRCSEGLYQYQKFKYLNDLVLKDQMQKANGQKAFKLSRQLNHKVCKDWENNKVEAMRQTLKLKFSDETLKQKLLQTGSRFIVENCHKNGDSFWADNGDGSGKNMMGVLLMELREQLGGKGVVESPKQLKEFYQTKCRKCQDPCYFDNDGKLHDKCVYHSGLMEN